MKVKLDAKNFTMLSVNIIASEIPEIKVQVSVTFINNRTLLSPSWNSYAKRFFSQFDYNCLPKIKHFYTKTKKVTRDNIFDLFPIRVEMKICTNCKKDKKCVKKFIGWFVFVKNNLLYIILFVNLITPNIFTYVF